jgi:hypothetical protein
MKKIDTIKMVRKTRDKQGKEITGKTTQEVIDYYRKKARDLVKK